MHIPDMIFGASPFGVAIGVVFCVIALIFVVLSVKWAMKNLNESKIVILSVIAAGIFALQAFNLPTGFGVSGHLVGGALAAIVLGSPFAAVFILTVVLIIQALVFGDGGVLALGVNIINMGVVAGAVGYYSFNLLKKKLPLPVCAGVAGWLACVIAACLCAVEIALVGAVPLTVGLPAMFIYHAIIGIIEGVITCVIITLIFKARPELSGGDEKAGISLKKFLVIGLIVALVIGVGAVFLASSNPDGLDSTFLINENQKKIFSPSTGDELALEEKDPINWSAPMPDYALGDSALGAVIALVIGIFGALILIFVAAKLAGRKSGK